jgi:glycosyltransferase involved in cell wall biosynthesis
VRSALAGGEAGLLVPPDDREALVAAIRRLTDDGHLRRTLAARGLAVARGATLEAEAEHVARFIAADGLPDGSPAAVHG